ncbi:synaptonemal complex protein 2-like [Morphnus guianensis]
MAQEEKSKERNREVNVLQLSKCPLILLASCLLSLPLQLESLLIDAFKGKGFEKISELLEEREIEPPQKYSESLFNQLDKALRKELDKNEFQNVSLLLKCIQLYFKSDLQEGTNLFIEQGLVLTDSFNFYLVSWFERARGFVILIDPNENKFLMLLLEDFFDSALVICKCSNEGKKELVNLFLPELGHLVTEANICCALRQEALRTLNSILDSVPREERKKFPLSEEMCSLTKDIAKTILAVGDYDLQVALSEALCRLMTKKWRDDLVHHWFEDNYLAEAFKEIKDREFETDCRKFLNLLNERLGDERRVYSFPCISAFADTDEVKKPSDEKLEEFWIDFNTGSQSVTFYVDSSEGALWDSVRLSKEAVSGYSLKEGDGEKTVKIYMKIPATLNKTEATKIKITFSAKFEILSILRKVLGDEKMSVPKKTLTSLLVICMFCLWFHVSEQNMVNSGVTMITVRQQTNMEDANQTSGQAWLPSVPYEKPLEEEPMEESTPKVSEAKGKILGQKVSSQNQRNYGTENKNEESNKLERRQSKYRKHLFSESNNENTSTGQSEKSWILDPQRESLPKSLDYTRKRSRVRSKLKVLPVSSASSGSDYQPKKGASRRRAQKEMLRKKSTSNPKGDNLPTVNLAGISSLIFFNALEKFLDDILSGTVIKKPKFSSWETSHLSSDTSYKSRKHFDSVEKEVEIQTGQQMDDSVDDAFFSKMLSEDFSDSGVITAFESFIGQLKKLFSSRYQRMETSAQNALRTSEKNVSALLNQIHKCRLSKLETFQKIVVEELASLEKETQMLANMEKDAVDFWNAQLLKLNSFCNQQKQRIQSVDSALGETAKSFADSIQNTTYEHPMKKAVENNVFIIPSD